MNAASHELKLRVRTPLGVPACIIAALLTLPGLGSAQECNDYPDDHHVVPRTHQRTLGPSP